MQNKKRSTMQTRLPKPLMKIYKKKHKKTNKGKTNNNNKKQEVS